ncbi:hypothetical protein OROHE_001496 [Orobanche hederae]
MPKERRERSVSLERSRLSPFPCSSSSKQSLPKNPLEDDNRNKQWEDARCPVCMEHPHNAILLLCSSHEKGCRPFMCDTSYRHSNCFDQFRKSLPEAPSDVQVLEDVPQAFPPAATIPEPSVLEMERGRIPSEDPVKPKLVCPLCRGPINGWVVVDPARRFMNAKSRSCACETCDYSGTYKDLRKHARLVHPLVRPTDIDLERQHNWRRLERQRDLGDLLSTLQSSMGEDRGEGSTLTIDESGFLTVFFLVRFIGPGRTSNRTNNTARARLWGEPYDGEPDSEGDDDGSSMRSVPRHYVRRRLHRNPDNHP